MYLHSIGGFMAEDGRIPSLRELANREGVAVRAAHKAVIQLRAKGFLGAGRRGQITVTDKGKQAMESGE